MSFFFHFFSVLSPQSPAISGDWGEQENISLENGVKLQRLFMTWSWIMRKYQSGKWSQAATKCTDIMQSVVKISVWKMESSCNNAGVGNHSSRENISLENGVKLQQKCFILNMLIGKYQSGKWSQAATQAGSPSKKGAQKKGLCHFDINP